MGLLILLNFFVPTIKRNNPFNVRNRQKGYYGDQGLDENNFIVFSHWSFGLLAGLDIIRIYQEKGFTVENLISTFSAGDVSNYIQFVCVNAGVNASDKNWSVPDVALQMCRFELGFQPFNIVIVNIFYYLTLLIY